MTDPHPKFCRLGLAAFLLLPAAAPCLADDFAQQMLAAHNRWRADVHVPKLAWSDKLAAYAQQWAEHLKEHNACKLEHRAGGNATLNGDPVGENLAWKWSSRAPAGGSFLATPAEMVDGWGAEIKFYDAASGECQGGVCGHYTQLVWRTTTEVGCGRASCGNAEAWVCNYLPAGNYVGEKPY
jgi:pathogenesis-related protein 1